MNEQVKILRAFRPGDVVFIEVPGALSQEMHRRYVDYLKNAVEETGVKFVLLTDGARLAAAEERSEAL